MPAYKVTICPISPAHFQAQSFISQGPFLDKTKNSCHFYREFRYDSFVTKICLNMTKFFLKFLIGYFMSGRNELRIPVSHKIARVLACIRPTKESANKLTKVNFQMGLWLETPPWTSDTLPCSLASVRTHLKMVILTKPKFATPIVVETRKRYVTLSVSRMEPNNFICV